MTEDVDQIIKVKQNNNKSVASSRFLMRAKGIYETVFFFLKKKKEKTADVLPQIPTDSTHTMPQLLLTTAATSKLHHTTAYQNHSPNPLLSSNTPLKMSPPVSPPPPPPPYDETASFINILNEMK